MPMTKAERAYVEELQIAVSLHWPVYPEPKPMTADQIKEASEEIERRDKSARRDNEKAARGWFFNAHGEGRISFGWKNNMLQNRDSLYADNPSRMGEPMYATKPEALMALRLQKTREFARVLASIDAKIRETAA